MNINIVGMGLIGLGLVVFGLFSNGKWGGESGETYEPQRLDRLFAFVLGITMMAYSIYQAFARH